MIPFWSIIGSSLGLGFGYKTDCHWGLWVAMAGQEMAAAAAGTATLSRYRHCAADCCIPDEFWVLWHSQKTACAVCYQTTELVHLQEHDVGLKEAPL